MLTHYDTVLTGQTGDHSAARLLLGTGAIVVDALRTGRNVVISDATALERIALTAPADSAPTDHYVIRWRPNTGRHQP